MCVQKKKRPLRKRLFSKYKVVGQVPLPVLIKEYLPNKAPFIRIDVQEELKYGMLGEVILEETKYFEENKPIGFENIQNWLEHRRASRHRKHIAKLLHECGCDNLESYIRVSYALNMVY